MNRLNPVFITAASFELFELNDLLCLDAPNHGRDRTLIDSFAIPAVCSASNAKPGSGVDSAVMFVERRFEKVLLLLVAFLSVIWQDLHRVGPMDYSAGPSEPRCLARLEGAQAEKEGRRRH